MSSSAAAAALWYSVSIRAILGTVREKRSKESSKAATVAFEVLSAFVEVARGAVRPQEHQERQRGWELGELVAGSGDHLGQALKQQVPAPWVIS